MFNCKIQIHKSFLDNMSIGSRYFRNGNVLCGKYYFIVLFGYKFTFIKYHYHFADTEHDCFQHRINQKFFIRLDS